MKKQYFNPMPAIVLSDLQDILTSSGAGVLWQEEGYGDTVHW